MDVQGLVEDVYAFQHRQPFGFFTTFLYDQKNRTVRSTPHVSLQPLPQLILIDIVDAHQHQTLTRWSRSEGDLFKWNAPGHFRLGPSLLEHFFLNAGLEEPRHNL